MKNKINILIFCAQESKIYNRLFRNVPNLFALRYFKAKKIGTLVLYSTYYKDIVPSTIYENKIKYTNHSNPIDNKKKIRPAGLIYTIDFSTRIL